MSDTESDNEYDAIVVGGGAAGLSAALVLTRARRRVAVVDGGRPRNAPAAHMQGFLSRDGLPPAELVEMGRAEVTRYGGHLVEDTVSGVVRHEGPRFDVRLASGTTLATRRVIVATGLRDEIPDVAGAWDRWGRDLLHCPYCHGHEVRDEPLGVLGQGSGPVQHALLVRQWSPDVVLFTHGSTPTAEERQQLSARGIVVDDRPVRRLVVEDDELRGVELDDGSVVARRAVFVRPRFVPHSDLLVGLGCATGDDGWPVVDPTGATTVPGVWAAGNVANPRAQVITAAGEGSAAAIALNNDLVDEDVRHALTYATTEQGATT
ncbi:NAD(P)/FAD-dependent oxidoreductase [Nocardioides sp.]|uniref:NAD(P)/FAD-dependent oxidoreductase n=1 Tax=Nocardioides sp. TaxID=35761 RepID=UPI001A34E225|nr:NAD(P)/FAD-dependent oxidoreductase [Nocardioides sp.]MBJ7356091.1 NAD(P)/FAD-dependent oxidoreductase [Nocardioides sp.]